MKHTKIWSWKFIKPCLAFLPLLFALTLSLSANAQVQSLHTCYGGACSPLPSGPSPFVGTNNRGLNDASYEAYRNARGAEYQQYVGQLNQQFRQYATQNVDQLRKENESRDETIRRVVNELQAQVPELPPTIASSSPQQRVAANPTPSGWTRPNLEAQLDSTWDSVRQGDPISAAENISKALAPYAAPASGGDNEALRRVHRFLMRDLAQSDVVDGQGLYKNLPHTNRPGTSLQTDARSPLGHWVRGNINQLLGTQSVVATHCAAAASSASASTQANCASYDMHAREVIAANYFADRLAAVNAALANDPAFQLLRQSIDMHTQVMTGLGKGVFGGVVGLGEGLVTLVTTNPMDLARGIGNAIQNYDQTYDLIKRSVVDSYDEFLTASPERRAEMVGRVGFEVATMFVGVGEVAAVVKGSTAFAVATERVMLGAAVIRATQVGEVAGRLTATTANAIREVATAMPATARRWLQEGTQGGFGSTILESRATGVLNAVDGPMAMNTAAPLVRAAPGPDDLIAKVVIRRQGEELALGLGDRTPIYGYLPNQAARDRFLQQVNSGTYRETFVTTAESLRGIPNDQLVYKLDILKAGERLPDDADVRILLFRQAENRPVPIWERPTTDLSQFDSRFVPGGTTRSGTPEWFMDPWADQNGTIQFHGATREIPR